MKQKFNTLISLVLLFTFFQGSPIAEDNAREIVARSESNIRGKTSESDVSIIIERPSWKREMGLHSWTKGTKYSMILLTSPAKEKGIVYLKCDKEVWNYIPSIERVIKLPPSMMSQSWMGTDFTNDDLVKEASAADDYTHTLSGKETIAGRECYRIEMIPKPTTAVVWGKVIVWIDVKDYLQLRAEFYDEDGGKVNTMECSEIKTMGGRTITTRMEMIPADKKGYKTILIYNSIAFDKEIAQDFFSTKNIKNVK